ncbi:MAG: NeuD/PglB/VioB family sugar acetyltransferase [Candidatus Sericytochromatia bacterium]
MRLLIWGAGALGRSVVEMVQSLPETPYTEIAFVVDGPAPAEIMGLPVRGDRRVLAELDPATHRVCLASALPVHRLAMLDFLDSLGLTAASVVDPRALVRPSAQLGDGCIVFPNAVIHTAAQLGRAVLVQTGSSVSHDNVIGEGCTLHAGVNLLGAVTLAEGARVGAGALIHSELNIGRWSLVGMGAVVLASVPDYATVAGHPARLIAQAEGPPPRSLYPLA